MWMCFREPIGTPEVTVEQLTNTDNIDANRYQFNISAWGWQNVDMLTTKMKGEETEISVQIPQAKDNATDVYLVVPGIRVFLAGARRAENGEVFYFIDPASELSLPQKQKAFIIAMTESDNSMLFGKTDFITGGRQQIQLSLKAATAAEINDVISETDAADLQIRAKESKNAAEAKSLQKEKKSIDSLKPANCDCDKVLRTYVHL
ncbi:hypothetical protein HHL16_07045 [Pseudoflavitalea sp. G-6-1-2]|uniref:hypothetical protein n=1 Tax=Pseudoflavitalea sp. G-6-1-2 TaxID=2728841 RepID=UPI00146AC970|nr:hypothetical protein [Pseudoflavitalea sp. G-6-1-2]NML20623.1 hypothetical protein [Pseudoflavitalea sp. G-6-1-2]